jgi:signal transduction histidine kinase
LLILSRGSLFPLVNVFKASSIPCFRTFQGTGLGLYISKNIIESHGGSMWAENNNGKGATFSFKIPLIKTDMIQNSSGMSI